MGELKIDRELIQGIAVEGNRKSEAVVRTTIELGHSLGLRVVAEGVENVKTFESLVSLDCDLAQGYFLSPPVPADELTFPSPRRDPGTCERSGRQGNPASVEATGWLSAEGPWTRSAAVHGPERTDDGSPRV